MQLVIVADGRKRRIDGFARLASWLAMGARHHSQAPSRAQCAATMTQYPPLFSHEGIVAASPIGIRVIRAPNEDSELTHPSSGNT